MDKNSTGEVGTNDDIRVKGREYLIVKHTEKKKMK
jgi:hypothetical protein